MKAKISPARGRIVGLLLVFLCSVYGSAAASEQPTEFQQAKNEAYREFFKGQLQSAVKKLITLAPQAPTKLDKADLQRDIIEICAAGFFFDCVSNATTALANSIQNDKSLDPLRPELLLYWLKEAVWSNREDFLQQFLKNGGPSNLLYPPQTPGTYAEMQLALHPVFVNRNDFKSAVEARSAAIAGLFLGNPDASYLNCKILVHLLSARYEEQDIAGAFQLLSVIEPYIQSQLSKESVLYADYRMLVGNLLSFTNDRALTISTLGEVENLYEKLDIAPFMKEYRIAAANNLRAAAIAVEGNRIEARRAHDQNPVAKQREKIILRGYFETQQEFFYGVVDVFLSALNDETPDPKWKPLFDKKLQWKLSENILSVFDSYRDFSLASLALGVRDRPAAAGLYIEAARKRVASFERFQRANLEGFQLPGLVDKIVIGAALQFAAEINDPDAADLMLKGSEILLRNLRFSISDEAVLLASQPNERMREKAHAYINLVQQKRDWELNHIKQWLNQPKNINRGEILREYGSLNDTLSKLKSAFLSGSNFVRANGLPTLKQVRDALDENQTLVSYFPALSGFGRLCVTKNNTSYSFGLFNEEGQRHIRLLEFATTANYAPDPNLDSQFPVDSSIFVYKLLFDGLESCLKNGSRIVIALPNDFAGVPISALLKESPPKIHSGYDLRKADWLIKQHSFSLVVSPRQFLASRTNIKRDGPRLQYLGIGDPMLRSSGQPKFQAGNPANKVGALSSIPETAMEIKSAEKSFDSADRTVLLGDEATEDRFRKEAIADYQVIHFATHGLFSNEREGIAESALVLTPGASAEDKFDDGILDASEIARLTLRAELVVLSACNSAKFDPRQANRGVHDLQAAFTVAGAPTILAAMWSIDSETATSLMVQFFENWRLKGLTANDALAETMKSYLDRADDVHQHPRFWAPFVVFGNGSVKNQSKAVASVADGLNFQPLPGFASGGEVLDAASLGNDVVMSIMGDWDGKRMAGILSLRTTKGEELWRATSREISAGKLATNNGRVYAIGLQGAERFTTVLRSFDASGKLVWLKALDEMTGYLPVDIVASDSSLYVFVSPPIPEWETNNKGYLIQFDLRGQLLRKQVIELNRMKLTFGAQAKLALLGARVAVVVNNGSDIKIMPSRKNTLGMPLSCFVGEGSTVAYFDSRTLSPLTKQTIDNFRVASVAVQKGKLLLGGEHLDGCSQKGVAAIKQTDPDRGVQTIWKDDDFFPGTVRGILLSDKMAFLVNHERPIGVDVTKTTDPSGYEGKRWGDDNQTIRYGALYELLASGQTRRTRTFSAGLSVFFDGGLTVAGAPVFYGTLGGEPAVTKPLH